MARQRTDMHRLQELVRLHRLGRTAREVASMLGMGRNTFSAYAKALDAAGLLEGEAPGSARHPPRSGRHLAQPDLTAHLGGTPPLAEHVDALRHRRLHLGSQAREAEDSAQLTR